jgi:hypothetical protein
MAFVSTLLHPFVTISCPTRLRWRRGEPCSIGLAVASAHILLACHNREETECRKFGKTRSSNQLTKKNHKDIKKSHQTPFPQNIPSNQSLSMQRIEKRYQNKSSSNQNLQPIVFATKLLWRRISLSCGSGAVEIRMGCLFVRASV